ncbi:MAG: ABC transporter ATP-binding protein [Microbacterium sp.]
MKDLWRTSRRLLPLLPPGARRYLLWYSLLSASLALLDVAALGILALVMGPMISGGSVTLPLLGDIPERHYVTVIVAVCGLIVLKSILSLAMRWVATRRFAQFELEIGNQLFRAYIHAPWTDRLARNSAELVRLADVGIGNTTSGLLLPLASIPTEIATFFSVFLVLVVAQPLTAALTISYIGLLGVLLYLVVNPRAVTAGRVNRDYSFKVARLMTEMVSTLKEITLRDKSSEVADVVTRNRWFAVKARSNSLFLGQAPKYVLEAALVLGFLLVGGVAYWRGGIDEALGAVALFGIAGFRMIPAVTRLQGLLTQTSSNLPHARRVIEDITAAEGYVRDAEVVGRDAIVGDPERLVLQDVAFTYPGSEVPAISSINLAIEMGTHVALVGSSGAGKTTLVDVLLGLLVPQVGRMTIGDQVLADVLADWRSRVGYVPQDVSLFNGSVAQNVALSWDSPIDEERVRYCLERAQLLDAVEARGGIDVVIGERGLAFSGGQRQRLGIARALYTDPLVLVMDEATSALDTATEDAVTRAMRELHGSVTVITVAHRLATIREADQVCFLQHGTIAARGTFEEVVAAEPEFARQAALAGLA